MNGYVVSEGFFEEMKDSGLLQDYPDLSNGFANLNQLAIPVGKVIPSKKWIIGNCRKITGTIYDTLLESQGLISDPQFDPKQYLKYNFSSPIQFIMHATVLSLQNTFGDIPPSFNYKNSNGIRSTVSMGANGETFLYQYDEKVFSNMVHPNGTVVNFRPRVKLGEFTMGYNNENDIIFLSMCKFAKDQRFFDLVVGDGFSNLLDSNELEISLSKLPDTHDELLGGLKQSDALFLMGEFKRTKPKIRLDSSSLGSEKCFYFESSDDGDALLLKSIENDNTITVLRYSKEDIIHLLPYFFKSYYSLGEETKQSALGIVKLLKDHL